MNSTDPTAKNGPSAPIIGTGPGRFLYETPRLIVMETPLTEPLQLILPGVGSFRAMSLIKPRSSIQTTNHWLSSSHVERPDSPSPLVVPSSAPTQGPTPGLGLISLLKMSRLIT